jgi:hypothetical protein
MNTKTISLVARIISILFALFGTLVTLSSLLILLSSGIVGYANSVATSIGESATFFPYEYALFGSILTLALGATYLAGAYSLFTMKKWSYYPLFAVGGIGILLFILNTAYNAPAQPIELLWSVVYLVFGFVVVKNQNLFKS